ncbi:MAG: HepT-like ribonuclease domain-containing protein [Paenibacillaceae bacterium]
MYYVNREQIERRLAYLSTVRATLRLLRDKPPAESLIDRFALERAIHVAAECVTDIGSYIIDGFVMRDAASYEDIVDILFGEDVFSRELFELLSPLVKMRKPLVQSYYDLNNHDLTTLSLQLPEGLDRFTDSIVQYLSNELGDNK